MSEFKPIFAEAARTLLVHAWEVQPRMPVLVSNAIRCVARSFSANPSRARELLSRILEEPHFSKHASEEGQWLTDGIKYIAPADPEFAAEIYDVFFSRPAPQEGKTWLGGNASRILPLTSSHKQDYEFSRWHLKQAFPEFLNVAAQFAMRALSSAVIGTAVERYDRRPREEKDIQIDNGAAVLRITEDDLSLQEWRRAGGRTGDPEEDMLVAFVKFLRTCSEQEFRAAIGYAMSERHAASVWARIFGIGAERDGVADDLLWRVASEVGVLEMRGLLRDVLVFLRKAFPVRPAEQRKKYETALVNGTNSAETADRWKHIARRFFAEVPLEALATEKARELRAALETEGNSFTNMPLVSIETDWLELDTDRVLERAGIDLQGNANQAVRAALRPLEEMLAPDPEGTRTIDVPALWRDICAVIEEVDRHIAPSPDEEVLHAALGSVAQGLERIALAPGYDQSLENQPKLSELLALLNRLAKSRYPKHRAEDDPHGISWGNWDVRVYIASAFMGLAPRFGADQPTIIAHARSFLADSIAAVRLQVVRQLNVLWDIDRSAMWSMAELVATNEKHPDVLASFVAHPLERLRFADLERVEKLIGRVIEKIPRRPTDAEREHRRDLAEAIGRQAAHLWVGQAHPAAHIWIRGWVDDVEEGREYLWHTISALREALFLKYRPEASDDEISIQDRARSLVQEVVRSAGDAMRSALAREHDDLPSDKKDELISLYNAGNQLIEHSVNQLYFGAGAFRKNDPDEPGLKTKESMRLFLHEYGPILEDIGRVGAAATIHHLVELYEYLIEAAPENVFDLVAALLVGPAAREGYHYESLAANVLVRMVQRYLADYRAIFEETARRVALVSILELFSSAGWPDALKLLYELPDLFR